MLNVLNGVCLYYEEPNTFSVGVNGLNIGGPLLNSYIW